MYIRTVEMGIKKEDYLHRPSSYMNKINNKK